MSTVTNNIKASNTANVQKKLIAMEGMTRAVKTLEIWKGIPKVIYLNVGQQFI